VVRKNPSTMNARDLLYDPKSNEERKADEFRTKQQMEKLLIAEKLKLPSSTRSINLSPGQSALGRFESSRVSIGSNYILPDQSGPEITKNKKLPILRLNTQH
jgi:hypothetical protein